MTSQLAPVVGRVYHAVGSYLTLLAVADTAYAVPFVPPRQGLTFDQIGVRVSTAGSGANCDVRFAIYHDDGKGRPGKLLADYGAATGLTTEAAHVVALTGTLDRPMLWGGHPYWIVALFDGAATTQPTVAAIGAAAVPQMLGNQMGSATIAALPIVATTGVTGLTGPSTYAAATALPDYGSSITWTQVATAMPLVGLRAA
jgi:hypothetical protein